MNNHRAITSILAVAVLVWVLLMPVSCSRPPEDTLKRIRDTKRLIVVTDNNANTYYNYRGRPMGFEYELAEMFADRLGVELKVITPGWDEMFKALISGRGDLVAAGLTITEERREVVDFSDDYLEVQQQVVVHKNNRSIQEARDLEGKKIHVRARTSYHQRLLELKEDGLDFEIVLHRNTPTEELIRDVAEEKIEVTIADSNIALLNRRYYPDIRVAFPIAEPQYLGWAVRKGDERFLEAVNGFFDAIRENGGFGRVYEKYYSNVHIFDYLDLKKFHRVAETHLPDYEPVIKREAGKHGFDWRMIAAVVYQESHFNPRARSFTGVRGLMQVTQRTAREMGISDRSDPEQSVQAGVQYLSKLYGRFREIENPRTRLLFALASYNVGYGHVRDAQAIARKKGWDPRSWSAMEKALPLLRLQRYYRETKYGYARGTEPVRYVERILTYFDILKSEARV